MTRWVLFLSGRYCKNEIENYRKLCKGAKPVAVDGGCRFFINSGLMPDFVIGDFDSIGSIPRRIREKAELIRFPKAKDKTDLHLAIEHAVKHGAGKIEIVDPHIGQIDHFLGNLMLLGRYSRSRGSGNKIEISITGRDFRATWLHDGRLTFVDCVGDTVSVIPISVTVKLTCRGMEFPADSLRIRRGDSRSLRNRISAKRATVEVSGDALVVHYSG